MVIIFHKWDILTFNMVILNWIIKVIVSYKNFLKRVTIKLKSILSLKYFIRSNNNIKNKINLSNKFNIKKFTTSRVSIKPIGGNILYSNICNISINSKVILPVNNKLSKRYLTTLNNITLNKESINKNEDNLNMLPKIILPENYELSSSDILKDKKMLYIKLAKLSGIYMYINKINGKKYIGSSNNLKRRLSDYLSESYLKRAKTMLITRAILKHGINNFELYILEYCDKDELKNRELHYFELYLPEYNISKTPGRPERGTGWKHDITSIEKMRKAAILRNSKEDYIEKLSNSQPTNIKVISIDILTGEKKNFNSINSAARFYEIDRDVIYNNLYLKNNKPCLKRYNFIANKPLTESNISQKNSMSIQVIDVDTNITYNFLSQGQAARKLGIHQNYISKYLSNNRTDPLDDKYIIKKINI